jgi:addiction module RelE/StbE family toxin
VAKKTQKTPVIIWSPEAREDFLQIILYLQKEMSSAVACDTGDKIMEAANNLIRFPMKGRRGRAVGTREWVLTYAPYIIIYQCESQKIDIIRVMHSSRLWSEEML